MMLSVKLLRLLFALPLLRHSDNCSRRLCTSSFSFWMLFSWDKMIFSLTTSSLLEIRCCLRDKLWLDSTSLTSCCLHSNWEVIINMSSKNTSNIGLDILLSHQGKRDEQAGIIGGGSVQHLFHWFNVCFQWTYRSLASSVFLCLLFLLLFIAVNFFGFDFRGLKTATLQRTTVFWG